MSSQRSKEQRRRSADALPYSKPVDPRLLQPFKPYVVHCFSHRLSLTTFFHRPGANPEGLKRSQLQAEQERRAELKKNKKWDTYNRRRYPQRYRKEEDARLDAEDVAREASQGEGSGSGQQGSRTAGAEVAQPPASSSATGRDDPPPPYTA